MAIRTKSGPQSVTDLLSMPNLKRASEIIPEERSEEIDPDPQKADAFFGTKREKVKRQKPAPVKTENPYLDREPKIPLSGKSEKVSVRLDETYIQIAKDRGEKMSEVISSAMAQFYRQMGWL